MKPRTILIAASAPLILLAVLRPWAGDAAPAAHPAPAVAPSPRARLDARDLAGEGVRAELAELRADVSRLGAAPTPKEERSPEEQRACRARGSGEHAAIGFT
jgi:hypothetical protein